MCGICGFTGDGDQARLARMLRRLEHRGPDEEGLHHEPGITLGARRLRIIDPEGGHQPIANETGTIWVVLNGEIYNYRELRDELTQKGHRFVSQCDTEVLVHLYEQEGEEGIHRLRGMFAFALWDRERQTLLLVRDRMGIKPLYYAIQPEEAGGTSTVVFASELPALLSAVSPRSIDPRALAQYLSLLYVPAPRTVFEGVQQLLPGELLKTVNGRVETRRYYHPARAVARSPSTSPSDAVEPFLERLRGSVRAHLVSDVPLGLFLSGGLDSGAILAMMRAVTNGTIRSFSIGYDEAADQAFDELDAARALARHFGTHHTEERLRPDAVTLLPKMVAAMGEPFADSSAIPTYLVSEVARRSVEVALSGIGGDELFGGYPRYLGMRLAEPYARLPVAARAWVSAHIAPWLPEGHGNRDQVGRLKRFLREGHQPAAIQYLRWITFLPPEWGSSAFSPEFLEQAEWGAVDRAYSAAFDSWPSQDLADRAMGLDLQTYLPDDLLRMGDRLSMAHSLELRVPFCDHELLSFALMLPTSVRFTGWRLKGFMREALRHVLPRTTLAQPKFGFQVPLARWLREDLREMLHDLLSNDAVRRRGWLRPEYVRWLLHEHETGARNFADQLYSLLVLELWHRTCEA
ncbi:MAG: asparagine synthase (glutamine-hydrolyzing) [Nitrospirae bacterium]|nr:asparagine synthase (glutamine-hydrolyzing) [Nitrospirota bacterium]